MSKRWQTQWRVTCVKEHPFHTSVTFGTKTEIKKVRKRSRKFHDKKPIIQRRILSEWAIPTQPKNLKGDRDGGTFDYELDGARLNAQMSRVYGAMKDGRWYSLDDISAVTGDNLQSISARIRDFRKEKFGSHIVNRERSEESAGLWFYQLIWNDTIPVPEEEVE